MNSSGTAKPSERKTSPLSIPPSTAASLARARGRLLGCGRRRRRLDD
jgi:hypothetical protein